MFRAHLWSHTLLLHKNVEKLQKTYEKRKTHQTQKQIKQDIKRKKREKTKTSIQNLVCVWWSVWCVVCLRSLWWWWSPVVCRSSLLCPLVCLSCRAAWSPSPWVVLSSSLSCGWLSPPPSVVRCCLPPPPSCDAAISPFT